MKTTFLLNSVMAGLLVSTPALAATTWLSGTVALDGPVPAADITIYDNQGRQAHARSDNQGVYRLDVSQLQAPLLLSAVDARLPDGGSSDNCLDSDRPRARCIASVVTAIKGGSDNTANINPLTDRLVSEVAVQLKLIGPQQWVERASAAGLTPELLQQPLTNLRTGLDTALRQVGVDDVAHFDPITVPMQADGQGVDALLRVINHNRGYDNNTGQAGGTILTDISFRPLVGLSNSGPWEPFDFPRAQQERQAIVNAKTRVLIVSDSTAATYEVSRLPRMGWGQVFQAHFPADGQVQVLNGARAGRSSRDFYHEGWYQQMARFLQPGDVVLIAHGHNDQNCNSAKPVRGAADVKNLCTYPNDAEGRPQFPAGQPELSFQHSLERYIKQARSHGAQPVLLTPTTRVMNADRKTAWQNGDTRPVVSSHLTRQNSEKGYAWVGDYAATVRKTARDNQVPFIDLERLTIDFANQHAADWTDYWLAVDANDPRYPWYKTQTAGVLTHPDTTHFQQRGAEAVASLVAGAIKQQPALSALAAQLN